MSLAASLLAGCCGSGGQHSQADAPAAQADSIVSDTINTTADDSVSGVQMLYVYRDTIVGQFVKGITDTLVLESGKMERDGGDWVPYTIYALGGSVDTLYFGPLYGLLFMNAGDLDGNGTDELWILPHSMSTFSYRYEFLTYRQGAWHSMLTERIRIGVEVFGEHGIRPDLFRKSKRLGYIHAKMARDVYVDSLGNRIPDPDTYQGEWMDFDGVEIIDTLLKLLPDGPEFEQYQGNVAFYG